MDELRKRRFLWGVFLAWAPWIFGYAFRGIFRGISEPNATGAWARSLTEQFVLIAVLVGQVASIVLLFRAFSSGHWVRSLFSMLSICLSAFLLVLVGLFLWLLRFQAHHRF